MSTLPDEIYFNILMNLTPDSLAAVALTCRRLYRISTSESFWREKLRQDFDYRHNTIIHSRIQYNRILRGKIVFPGLERFMTTKRCFSLALDGDDIDLINYFFDRETDLKYLISECVKKRSCYINQLIDRFINNKMNACRQFLTVNMLSDTERLTLTNFLDQYINLTNCSKNVIKTMLSLDPRYNDIHNDIMGVIDVILKIDWMLSSKMKRYHRS